MEKVSFLPNGQWELKKEAAKKLERSTVEPVKHTVEVHPHIDHLYRAKGLITDSKKPHLQLAEFKRAGFSSNIIKKIPRDANGKVTPKMIDEHIASLPKTKVNLEVHPYNWGSQQHRPGEQYAITAHLHPESKMKMDSDKREIWDHIKKRQHSLGQDYSVEDDAVTDEYHAGNTDQIGWSRIDANSKPNHWHVDEIQSDFQNKDKISDKLQMPHKQSPATMAHYAAYEDLMTGGRFDGKGYELSPDNHIVDKDGKIIRDHSEYLKEAERRIESQSADADRIKKLKENKGAHNELLSHISHGHDSPQHMIHSAVNALARKMGIGSMSMDTPEDQARQSGLQRDTGNTLDENHIDASDWVVENSGRFHDELWPEHENNLKSGEHQAFNNPNFKSALDEIGGVDVLTQLANHTAGSGSSVDLHNNAWEIDSDNDPNLNPNTGGPLGKKLASLSQPQFDAIENLLNDHAFKVQDWAQDAYNEEGHGLQNEERAPEERAPVERSKFDISKLPVHQIETYHKNPKKLGMELKDKKDILGEDDNDPAEKVQYMKLHKSLLKLKEALKKC